MANKLRECLIAWEKEKGSGKWSVLAFDGVIREGHQGAVQVTSYPVDSGFMVSDHAIRQNRIIEINSITSNFSMSVATSRKSFAETFNELMTVVSAAQVGAPVYDLGQVGDGVFENDKGAIDNTYAQATKYGRTAYDNDSLNITIPYTSITLGTITNPLLTALGGQVSLEKVDETLEIIDKLNATGQLVHLVTMRGVRPNCVIRQYAADNDVSNAYSLPCTLVFEQLNVIDVPRSEIQVATKDSDGVAAAEVQTSVRKTNEGTQTYVNYSRSAKSQVLAADTPIKLTEEFTRKNHKEVPFSTKFATRFVHDGIEYTLGKVRYNYLMGCWVTALQWRVNGVYKTVASMPLVAGVDLVQQYHCGLPSLVAVNVLERGRDPEGSDSLRLYIIEDFQSLSRS
ncbi:hypothetical protein QNH09_gp64 [Aeromonas phage PVN03]|uniref:Dit-like phage tail protein N-terminal domain-containing protein n=1 Tax=Aeromonas phage PVN03 TaxID=2822864 RepID=A0AAE7RB26_9CAUD|nr:hypothetical protein QNH09_gp64 [Aeromonas phage PVN03]QTQ06846.1 hypothetical protein [Aeromonas phage PVN03]